MTHDELIVYIDDSTNGLKHEHLFEKLLTNTKALRAAVELHYEHTSGSGDVYCYNCQQKYPCLTIQAIEKELK